MAAAAKQFKQQGIKIGIEHAIEKSGLLGKTAATRNISQDGLFIQTVDKYPELSTKMLIELNQRHSTDKH